MESEQALERIEKAKACEKGLICRVFELYPKEIETIRKVLKAVEIIKMKRVKVEWYCGDVFLTPMLMLSDDEYKLIKEVLK